MTSAITSVDIRKDYAYETLDATNVLVPTRISVRCETPPGTRKVELNPLALPFGLLDKIRIRAADATCTIEVVKMSGRVKSEALTNGSEMSMVLNDAKDNQDAADPDLKTVFALTKHFMNCRMIAAASIVRVLITFSDEEGSSAPPAAFTIEYDGANVLTHAEAAKAGPKYAFQLPPLTSRARMARNTKKPN